MDPAVCPYHQDPADAVRLLTEHAYVVLDLARRHGITNVRLHEEGGLVVTLPPDHDLDAWDDYLDDLEAAGIYPRNVVPDTVLAEPGHRAHLDEALPLADLLTGRQAAASRQR